MRLVSAAILSMVVSGCAFGQTYTISTFAGGGLPVNIPGTQAGLRSVGSVAVDRAGNVLFTDPYNHIVLRLDGTTGGVSLVAGNGTPGYSGDNGPATSAQLLLPCRRSRWIPLATCTSPTRVTAASARSRMG